MAFELSSDIEVQRRDDGQVMVLRHPRSPFTQERAALSAASVTDLADAYVAEVAPVYGLTAAGLDGSADVLRRETEKSVLDSTVVTYRQLLDGLPVWQAALEVRLGGDPPRVVSSSSTVHLDPEIGSAASDGAVPASSLPVDTAALEPVRRWMYRFDPALRFDPAATSSPGNADVHSGPPVLSLPPVPDGIRPGAHYAVEEILFDHSVPEWGDVHWRALVEPDTGAVLYLRAFVAAATACVFASDPVTLSGKPMDGGSPAADLDALRTTVPLLGLDAPVNGVQALRGEYIALTDTDPPAVAAPTTTTPFDFCYSAVTDDFAAASAYHHYDGLYRLVRGLGFDIGQYFDGTTFPVPTDHQGFGTQVNAAAHGNATGTGMGRYRNGLVRAGFPVGIATDQRVVLHEFGHALLWDHVGSPNFGFCHSAGDTLAAVLHDAGSRAPDRFVTFPFTPITRRHDRAVADGWAWGGVRDDTQYGSEQILSTLLFRVYRGAGGDDADLAVRRFAARYLVYLIVRAIGTLTVTSTNPVVLASAMMDADDLTLDFEGHPGGAWHKVIRWSFEQQGLYQPAGAPVPVQAPGAPPPVDVFIDDGRAGGYLPYLADFSAAPGVWNRRAPDGGTDHEPPSPGQANHLYVRVGNRGTAQADGVRVRVYQGDPAGGLDWPGGWQPAATPELATGPIAPNGSAVVGPFAWNPAAWPGEAVLASVTANGDVSNAETVNGPIPHRRLVPMDNNLAQRTMTGSVTAATSLLLADEAPDQSWRGLLL